MQIQALTGKDDISKIIDIQKDIHSFYQDSFSNLLWVFGIGLTIISGILAITGVLIPYLVARYQKREYDKKYNLLSESIEIKIKDIKDINENFKSKITDLEVIIEKQKIEISEHRKLFTESIREINNRFESSSAYSYYQNAILHLKLDDYFSGLLFLCSSLVTYLKLKSAPMIQMVNGRLIECLPHNNKTDIEMNADDIKEIITLFKESEDNAIKREYIKLEGALKKVKEKHGIDFV